jgi:flavin reductase (DIM6/NTAB) family NADH-FMN oxidoreductase RutF
LEIDLGTLEPRDAHDLLASAIIPRPIAWVCSINAEGQVNLAPFSFFTGVTWRPATLCVSITNRPDGSRKDTVRNIEESGDFVVNMVSQDLAPRMVETAATLPYGVNEAAEAKVPLVPSVKVKAPRVRESRVAFECALDRIVTVGEGPCAGNLVLGTILLMHVRDDLIVDGKTIDPVKLDAVGRLSGGTRYCTVKSVFEIPGK